MTTLRVLCFGDIVGRPGREVLRSHLAALRAQYRAQLIIANGENAAGGVGIDPAVALELRASGIDVLTLGDHTWHKREMRDFLDQEHHWCIRPANYPQGAPGRGGTVVKCRDADGAEVAVGVINVIGRVFSPLFLDDPFREVERLLANEVATSAVRIADVHAEASSEKLALARAFDGRLTAVVGTHTHVQTADERILPLGTAFITDLGMCGPHDGVIGMDAEVAIKRFTTGLPAAYKLAPAELCIICGVMIECDPATGKACAIERIMRVLSSIEVDLRR